MCRYPSKKCWNLRALKRNGEHHNLCDFHRQKANKNQRRLELKRKARAQGSSDLALGDKKRLRALKDTSSTRARRAPLSAHLAMKEEASAKQQQKQEAEVNRATAVSGLTSWFLQDLVLLDGVYDRAGFQVKDELPLATAASMSPIPFIELTHPPDAVDVETLAHILADAQGDACKSLEYATSGLDVPVSMYEGKTSPVDVGESWDSLDLGAASWLPVDQPSVNFDASAFVMDEDMFVADV
uniref:Uncharacterized protein n=1 Tax=Hyaloperonospora arabidopsidis (strain Emoy2) TaxID=559515 RepID=M4BT35_HYAAE